MNKLNSFSFNSLQQRRYRPTLKRHSVASRVYFNDLGRSGGSTRNLKTFRLQAALQTVMLAWLFVLVGDCRCLSGQSAPQAVTMRNGTRIFGELATVTAFSSKQPNPRGAQRISLVDDGIRRVFFNTDSAGNIAPLSDLHPLANPTSFEVNQRLFGGSSPGFGNLQFEPFNVYGHRLVRSRSTSGVNSFVQGITEITPHWTEVATLTNSETSRLKNWTMRIATSTIPAEVIRSLMEGQIQDRNDPSDYLNIVDFFLESEQYKAALEQLVLVGQKFPDMSDVIEEQKKKVRQARAQQWIRQVNQLIDVGQPELGGMMLSAFDRAGVAGEILAEIADIQAQLDEVPEKIAATRKPIFVMLDRFIEGDFQQLLEAEQQPLVKRFKQELEQELTTDNLDRLAAFNRLAGDDTLTALERLSTAISGWFLGSNRATQNFAVSQSFFPVRDLVVEYLTTADAARRRAILNELTDYEGGEPEYLAAMISQLTPPRAPDLSDVDYSNPLTYEIQVDEHKFQYHVQLPREYSPHRRYPCVFTLPGDKNIDRQIAMWCGGVNERLGTRFGQAMRNGYIVVTVDWKLPGQFEYKYTALEHLTIMKALRRSLQQFSIDTDRVFITGHGFGADAAYDIGISHPEHWAGIVGISGKIDKYPALYSASHKHVRLPVYSVVGEKDLASVQPSESAWNKWLSSKNFFDCTVVEYIGRSNELFVEEIVEVFKWMQGHRRRLPDTGGFKFEGKIRRPWDRYFWFFELHDIPLDKVVFPEFFGDRHPKPVEILAELKPDKPNKFNLKPPNQGSGATIWLSPEFVDFKKKIIIGGRGEFKDFVTPSRQILLEDVRTRCDRQHPYWANVRCVGKRWQANQLGR